MKALPPPTPGESPQAGDEGTIADDWMNQFTRFAEDASSEDLQQLWGRVLAGEINRPGSFSRHTLRFVAELDHTTAANCELALASIVDNLIPNTDDWQSGANLEAALDLQRMGLLEGVGSFGLSRTYTLSDPPLGILKHGQAIRVFGDVGKTVSISAILLTRLGKEVFSLLPPGDPAVTLRTMAGLLKEKPEVTRIELGNVDKQGPPRFVPTETLWTKPTPTD